MEEQAERAPLKPASVTAAEWTNINAFLVKAWRSITDKASFTDIRIDVQALSCAIDALEEELTTSKMDELLPAAAWWFIEAETEMRTQNKELADLSRVAHPDMRNDWAKGKLWRGP
ncbi:MAG: hypothetical protein M1831_004633 [Alyxoria varia]|nr:MAG: hypothetical protein M1831_004633 [Alyxoria varia]